MLDPFFRPGTHAVNQAAKVLAANPEKGMGVIAKALKQLGNNPRFSASGEGRNAYKQLTTRLLLDVNDVPHLTLLQAKEVLQHVSNVKQDFALQAAHLRCKAVGYKDESWYATQIGRAEAVADIFSRVKHDVLRAGQG